MPRPRVIPEQAQQRRSKMVAGLTASEAKDRVVQLIAEGHTNESAIAKVGRSLATYNQWRQRDPGFAQKVDRVRAKLRGEGERPEVGSFADFRKKYLKRETFWHQQQWVDLLEDREPSNLQDRQIFIRGRSSRILINTPPDHSKTTTLTIEYSIYRICKDPNVRIILISASRDMAKQFLRAIKHYLTDQAYSAMHEAFGPAGGFQVGSSSWTENQIYVGNRDSVEKDPTVQTLGIGGQIYGSRADLIIMDDTVTMKTAGTKGLRDKMMQWIRTEVSSRLHPQTGKLLLVGTRISVGDLYSQIIKDDENTHVWTYLTQPAILEEGETPDQNVTLWPERWSAQAIDDVKAEFGSDGGKFALVYLQQEDPEHAVFPREAVEKCCYGGNVGLLDSRVRFGGMAGLYVVAGLDPAASGFTAMVVLGLDRRSGVRWVLDVVNHKGMKPHSLREKMFELTSKYGIKEWRVEKNGLQTMLTQDRDVRAGLLQRGARLVEHHTVSYGTSGKWDADYGVASMAPLFLGALELPPCQLIAIPNNHTHKGVRALLDQLITFDPESNGLTDCVMALWFADLACRKAMEVGQQTHMRNRWVTNGQKARRHTIRLDDAIEAMRMPL